MTNHYDTIIIGSGPAGSSAAGHLAAGGQQVAIVDHTFGGTCALKGCTPKKVLAAVSEILRYACKLNGLGIDQQHTTLNWGDLINFKNSFTQPIPMLSKEAFRSKGIDIIEGAAAFTDEHTILVNEDHYSADHFIIATGNRPVELKIDGAGYLQQATDLFELSELPASICFIGGGYIAFEFAQILNKAGCEVHILEQSDRPLKQFEGRHAGMLVKMFLEETVHVHLKAQTNRIEKEDNRFNVLYEFEGNTHVIRADLVLNAAGRRPNCDALDLDKADVQYSDKGITTDDFLTTSAPHIYAIGDVTGKWPFTLSADYEGSVVAYNILHDRRKRVEYNGFPTVLFTSPKLAAVGYSKDQLEEEGIDYEVSYGSLAEGLMTRSVQEVASDYAVYHQGDKLLGAHLFSLKADEVINIFAMAIQHDISLSALKSTFMTYPSAVSEVRKML